MTESTTRRTFLQSSATLAAGAALATTLPEALLADQPRTNWAGNYTYQAPKVLEPSTTAEVQDAIRSVQSLRALGSRHSFNGIADSTTEQISTLKLASFELDRNAKTVTVGGGLRYGNLALALDKEGFALHNLASLPHITVAGSIATGTHGSGIRNGNLATSVRAIEFVSADGTLHTLSQEKDGEDFKGAVVSMGALGLVTRVTLAVEPTYQMTQIVYQDLDFAQLEHNFAAIMGSGYSVSLFTNWQKHRAWEVWIKRRVDQTTNPAPAQEFYGAKLATVKLHPVEGQDPEKTTDQLNIPGPWYARLPHFKMEFTPSTGREIQTEFFVPFEHAYEAVLAVEKLRDQITPHIFVTELRAIAADDLWMSMAYQRTSLGIHFTWQPDTPAVLEAVAKVQAALAPFAPRPHWAKVFTLGREQVLSTYPRFKDFQALAKKYDPQGKFRNQYMDEHLWA